MRNEGKMMGNGTNAVGESREPLSKSNEIFSCYVLISEEYNTALGDYI